MGSTSSYLNILRNNNVNPKAEQEKSKDIAHMKNPKKISHFQMEDKRGMHKQSDVNKSYQNTC